MGARDWSPDEINAIIEDYFAMLGEELRGVTYNKAARRRALKPRLRGRSESSIEFKHQNISAVLCELGLPYIQGYKPRCNYQQQLAEHVIQRVIAAQDDLAGDIDHHLQRQPVRAGLEPTEVPPLEGVPRPWRPPPGPIDFMPRERKTIGDAGEELVYLYERQRVRESLGSQEEQRVIWAARELGDGLGYDVQSVDVEAALAGGEPQERYLEVKTTTQGALFPFYLSANERRFALEYPQQFRLHRVFDVYARPRFFAMTTEHLQRCHAEPVVYRVNP